jgi:asparagine synthase (glutamine-hydrolysing)
MQAKSCSPVKTFSIGFSDPEFNEATHAKKVAQYLKTSHTELYVSSQDAMAVIPSLPTIYDEPFADPSQIPTFLVSQLARQQVAVVLSGDGGDELFCGYNRYAIGYTLWSRLHRLPRSLRQTLALILRNAPSRFFDRLQQKLPQRLQVSSLPDRLPKLADVLATEDIRSFYASLVSNKKPLVENWVLGLSPSQYYSSPVEIPKLPGLRELMMYWDQTTYLPDDVLTKVDRATMAVSLEARVPLLDHRLIEFAWRLPTALKYRDGEAKWILRQVLYDYVPKELIARPKMGFGVPIEHWLRGPLREWCLSLLDERLLARGGILNPSPIKKMLEEHLSGKRRWHYPLWNVLMFQAWFESQSYK